jgi:hypothetical protein
MDFDYTDEVVPHEGTLSGQMLLSYKLNWQSVMFVGDGDDREFERSGSPGETRSPGRVGRVGLVGLVGPNSA